MASLLEEESPSPLTPLPQGERGDQNAGDGLVKRRESLQLLLDLVRIELRHALKPFAHAFRKGANRIARLLHPGVFAIQPLLALLQLIVEQRERFLVGADFDSYEQLSAACE